MPVGACPTCGGQGPSKPGGVADAVPPRVIVGAAAAAAGLSLAPVDARDAQDRPLQGIIDVHHHVVPPAFLRSQPFFPPPVHEWRVEHSIEAMDRNGIATAISSVHAPGITASDPQTTRPLQRACNDFQASLCARHPGRFAMFASIAPLDIDGALAEIAYALDELGAVGIGFMTSYGKAYLAAERFAPLFDELNRRAAVVFVHPALPDIGEDFDPPLSRVPLEMPFDTARTLLGMIQAGTFARYPRIRFLFNHGGGALPVLHQRLDLSMQATPELRERYSGGLMAQLRNVYFDTVNAINAPSFAMLRQLVAIDKLLFGSDYPGHAFEANVEPLNVLPATPEHRGAIARGNALTLFPSLAGAQR